MRINSCWQFMGSDRAREWTGSCLGGVRVRGSKKFSWLVHHHGLASHSYLICQTVYMGSGLPTRKSVLNHSMTSNFCLLYKHKLKHKQAFCCRLRWRAGTELRGNFVLTQFTNRGGAYHQQSVSDLQLIGSPLRFPCLTCLSCSLIAHQHFHLWITCFSSEEDKSMHFLINLSVLDTCFFT